MKQTTTNVFELTEQDVRGAIYKLLISEGRLEPGDRMDIEWQVDEQEFKGATATSNKEES